MLTFVLVFSVFTLLYLPILAILGYMTYDRAGEAGINQPSTECREANAATDGEAEAAGKEVTISSETVSDVGRPEGQLTFAEAKPLLVIEPTTHITL